MKINSDFNNDIRTRKQTPGGYEWWYFDAIAVAGEYRIVVIFYDGNPFSTRYIKRLRNGLNEDSAPENFPAVSISVYEENETVFYSFTEYKPDEAFFSDDNPDCEIGSNKITVEKNESDLKYILNLKEKLPNGDAIVANLEFKSNNTADTLFDEEDRTDSGSHIWSLIQPRAEVNGNIRIYSRNEETKTINFEGTGYHDHNIGSEPMKNEFRDWYWGRYHFEYGTLIYYITNLDKERQHRAWIISKDNSRILHDFDDITLQDKSLSLFGMMTARKFILHNDDAQVNIQHSKILDNGPFYQRYRSDAFLHVPENDAVEVSDGFSEYIRPNRIHWRLFWPFINMRIRYRAKSPHWVQYSKRLYRWTW